MNISNMAKLAVSTLTISSRKGRDFHTLLLAARCTHLLDITLRYCYILIPHLHVHGSLMLFNGHIKMQVNSYNISSLAFD